MGSFIGDLFLLIGLLIYWLKDYQVFESQLARLFSIVVLSIAIVSILINFLFHFYIVTNFPFGFFQKIEFAGVFIFISYLGLELLKYKPKENRF